MSNLYASIKKKKYNEIDRGELRAAAGHIYVTLTENGVKMDEHTIKQLYKG